MLNRMLWFFQMGIVTGRPIVPTLAFQASDLKSSYVKTIINTRQDLHILWFRMRMWLLRSGVGDKKVKELEA